MSLGLCDSRRLGTFWSKLVLLVFLHVSYIQLFHRVLLCAVTKMEWQTAHQKCAITIGTPLHLLIFKLLVQLSLCILIDNFGWWLHCTLYDLIFLPYQISWVIETCEWSCHARLLLRGRNCDTLLSVHQNHWISHRRIEILYNCHLRRLPLLIENKRLSKAHWLCW